MKRNLKWKNEHIPRDVTTELITWIAKSEQTPHGHGLRHKAFFRNIKEK